MNTSMETHLGQIVSDDCAAQLMQAECAIRQSISTLLDDLSLEDELLPEPAVDTLWV